MATVRQQNLVRKKPVGLSPFSGDPFAVGLSQFYALNEGVGTTITDALGLVPLTISGSNPWSQIGSQLCLNLALNGQFAKATVPTNARLGWPVSGAFGCRLLGSASANSRDFCVTFDNSTTTPFIAYGCNRTTLTPNLRWNSAGTFGQIAGTALTTGVDAVISFTITSTKQTLYQNGVATNTASNAISNPTFGAAPQMCIGEVQAEISNEIFYWGGIWQANWTADMHAIIGQSIDSIWRIFQPFRGEWLFPNIASVGGPWPWFFDQSHSGGFSEMGL